jgi:beta-aspartyl-peptidase (threonine type)
MAEELWAPAVAGVRRAAAAALELLEDERRGASLDACVDAAVAAVRVLEDDPAFNAGLGSCMNELGELEVDSGIMRSRDLANGAVASVRDLAEACVVARAVMERSRHSLLVGEGARRFAIAEGVGRFGRELLWTAKAQARWQGARSGVLAADNRADTVGAVIRDRTGHFCALGSTGGTLLKLPGRVGDTPLVGAGFYAHPELGAAVATGVGEEIMRRVLCHELLRRAAAGEAVQAVAEQLCAEIHEQHGAAVGVLAVDPDGQVAIAHASDHMAWALARPGEVVRGDLRWPVA